MIGGQNEESLKLIKASRTIGDAFTLYGLG